MTEEEKILAGEDLRVYVEVEKIYCVLNNDERILLDEKVNYIKNEDFDVSDPDYPIIYGIVQKENNTGRVP